MISLLLLFVCMVSGLPYANPDDLSISGLSSGGYMAVQYHISYSKSISHVGVFAGGPFYCALGNVDWALSACMKEPDLIDLEYLHSLTETCVVLDKCDSTSHIQNSNIYLYSGLDDTVVHQGVMEKLKKFYDHYHPDSIKTVFNHQSEHLWPTMKYGINCKEGGAPYIGKCSYDASYDMLQTIFGDIEQNYTYGDFNSSYFVEFDQTKYVPDGYTTNDLSLGDIGYFFIPAQCYEMSCRLHVVFHGCLQYYDLIGTQFISENGLNEIAESNNIILVYPQTTKSEIPFNPKGCWDWWGFTSIENYANKRGPQMEFITNIINAFLKSKIV